MKRAFAVLILSILAGSVVGQTTNLRTLKVITLRGSGYQRGLMYGQQLKKEIAEVVALNKKFWQEYTHVPADSFTHQFLANTNFIPVISKYTPDILEEVKGIAAGSEQSFEDIFMFQLGDETAVYADRIKHDSTMHHCSGIGIPAKDGRPAFVSQNMDVPSWMDGHQVLLHILHDGQTPEQYILSCAGWVALTGMNEYGIGVCANQLLQLQGSSEGLPVAFMIRGLLQKKTANAALQLLLQTKHASGQNYIVGIADSVYDYEASANKVKRMNAGASGVVYHTNHPVVNDDVKPWYQDYYHDFLTGKTQNRNSETRFASLRQRAEGGDLKDDSFIKTALKSKDNPNNPVCRPLLPNKAFTFGSVIYTTSGKRNVQVTAGPPDESEYQKFFFVK